MDTTNITIEGTVYAFHSTCLFCDKHFSNGVNATRHYKASLEEKSKEYTCIRAADARLSDVLKGSSKAAYVEATLKKVYRAASTPQLALKQSTLSFGKAFATSPAGGAGGAPAPSSLQHGFSLADAIKKESGGGGGALGGAVASGAKDVAGLLEVITSSSSSSITTSSNSTSSSASTNSSSASSSSSAAAAPAAQSTVAGASPKPACVGLNLSGLMPRFFAGVYQPRLFAPAV